jgi:hypothetical protein
VKELVEQEGKRTIWPLRVLLRTWLVRFLIVIFYVTAVLLDYCPGSILYFYS